MAIRSHGLLFALAAAAFCVGAEDVGETPPTELLQLRDLYQENMEETLAPLRKEFLSKLDALEKRLAETRKLDQALFVRERRTSLALEWPAEIPAVDEAAQPDYSKLLRIYHRHAESRTRALGDKYVSALDRMEKQLIASRRLREAIHVRNEIALVRSQFGRSGDPGEEDPDVDRSPDEIREQLEGTSWKYVSADADGTVLVNRTLMFKSDGKATFKSPAYLFEWTALERGVIELSYPRWESVVRLTLDHKLEAMTGGPEGTTRVINATRIKR